MSKQAKFLFDFFSKLDQVKRAMKVLPTPSMALTTFALEEQNNG